MKKNYLLLIILAVCIVFSGLILIAPAEAGDLKLTYPNGGEILMVGQTYKITWDGDPKAESVLYLSTDSGASYPKEIGSTSGGSLTWKVPDMATSRARIKILNIQVTGFPVPTVQTIEDASDADFTIMRPLTAIPITPVTPVFPVTQTVIQFYIDSTEYYTNGVLKTMDTSPRIMEERTLLPIRFVAEPLGAAVGWEQAQQKVSITLGGKTVELWLGHNLAQVNGANQYIDPNNHNVVPIVVPPGRTMLPLRFIAENLGCKVDWDGAARKVTVTYPAP